jgi:hypothetical protein
MQSEKTIEGMVFLILILSCFLGTVVRGAITLAHDGNTVAIVQTVNISLKNTSSADTCYKLVVTSKALYHLSSEGIYTQWLIGALPGSPQVATFTPSPSNHVVDFVLRNPENYIYFLNVGNSTALTYKLQSSAMNLLYNSQDPYTGSQVPTKIFYSSAKLFLFYPSYAGTDAIVRVDNNAVYTLNSTNGEATQSSDCNRIVVVSQEGKAYIYSISATVSLVSTYTPPNQVSAGTPRHVSFDASLSKVLLTSGTSNPIVIYSISS